MNCVVTGVAQLVRTHDVFQCQYHTNVTYTAATIHHFTTACIRTNKMELLTYFSLSPSHFDTRSDDDTEKKVELPASVATAFAKYDFPVPGGYTRCREQVINITCL